jgi:hypothetical protein
LKKKDTQAFFIFLGKLFGIKLINPLNNDNLSLFLPEEQRGYNSFYAQVHYF